MTMTSIKTSLRAAAVEIDGSMWVRANTALRILNLSSGWYGALPRKWCVSELRRPARRSRGASRGIEIFWLLDALLRFAAMREAVRTRRRWTAREDQHLASLLVDCPVAEAARRLRRPVGAVRNRVPRLGGLRGLWLKAGYLTSGDLLRLTRKRSYGTIRRWRSMGLAATRAPVGKDMLFRLPELRTFFINHQSLLITMDPAARK